MVRIKTGSSGELIHYLSVKLKWTRQVWNRNELSPCERVMHDTAQPKRLMQKRIVSVWFHSRVSTLQLCLVQKWIISLNALFLQKYSTKKTKTRDYSNVINCLPCCNFTVNFGFEAAHEDRNTVKLQSRFSPIRLWPRWTTFVLHGCYAPLVLTSWPP